MSRGDDTRLTPGSGSPFGDDRTRPTPASGDPETGTILPVRVGEQIADRYRITRFLGQGGMGVVYEAQDLELGIPVALKTLFSEAALGKAGLVQLKSEVVLARQVTHRNVCRLHDLGRDPERDLLFATMELLDGETLSERLQRMGPFTTERAYPLVQQMVRGLEAAHTGGVVHLDFKCGNVMIVPDGDDERVVLTDFGLARKAASAPTEVAGTPAYMAPEQLRGTPAGPPADIYALGVVLYEMLTGRVPFEGTQPWQIVVRKIEEDPRSPKDLVPELPASWEEAILKCLSRKPEARYQRASEVVEALAGEAGALSALIQGVLPAERDAFVGRQGQLAELADLVSDGARIVTLVGAAGSGKTRLSQHYGWQTAGDWPGGVWFCDLKEARSLQGIATEVAAAFDVSLGEADPIAQLGAAMADRGRCLVILDNFEQIGKHAEATVGRWWEQTQGAVFLVTSRERLHLAQERIYPLDPLSHEEGVDLFVARASVHQAGFSPDAEQKEQIDRIVRRLDGLPLAIELAAARVRVMAPRQIAERLSQRFKLLSGGAGDARHATLRAAIDESWELLEPWERAAFAQCSVFDGGFTLEASEAVLDVSAWDDAPWEVDLIQALVDKSLLRIEGSGREPRFDMYVSLKEYAREKLRDPGAIEKDASGDSALAQAERRHGGHFAGFGRIEAIDALQKEGGAARARRLARERENLVTAIRRAVARGDGAIAVPCYAACWAVMIDRGPYTLGAELGSQVLAIPELTPEQKAVAFSLRGSALHLLGRNDEAIRDYRECLALSEATGNERLKGKTLHSLGGYHMEMSEAEQAIQYYERALEVADRLGDTRLEIVVLGNLGNLFLTNGKPDQARRHYERGIELARREKDKRSEAIQSGNLGFLNQEQGRLEDARRNYEKALSIHKERGDRRSYGTIMSNLGLLEREEGRLDLALEHFRTALAISQEVGIRRSQGIAHANMGVVFRDQERFDEAVEQYEQALGIYREVGEPRLKAIALGELGFVQAQQGRYKDAFDSFSSAEEIFRAAEDKIELGKLLSAIGRAHLSNGDRPAAQKAYGEAVSLVEEMQAKETSELGREVGRLREALAAGAAE